MSPPIDDIQRRRPVWQALSDLFLDTELDDRTFRYIARILAESGYDDEVLIHILQQEVSPVCLSSLISLVGEWACFNSEWLEESILLIAGQGPFRPPAAFYSVIEPDWKKVLALLPEARHVSGNRYRPYPVPDYWPATVVHLAEAVAERKDCGFALHDALLEAGHPELAEHFREAKHPKGCWVLTLILRKQ